MTDFAEMSHPERARYLASLEKECECGGISFPTSISASQICPGCGGSGNAPQFPMLRKTCQRDGCYKGRLYYTHKLNADQSRAFVLCDECHGRGWVVNYGPAALMEAADTFPDWSVGRLAGGEPVTAEVAGWPAEGVTPADALSLALCRAVEGEK